MGTRFKLFVQPPFDDPSAKPEVVTVSCPVGSVGPGPSDTAMYVVEPIGKNRPYGFGRNALGRSAVQLPPWTGPVLPPALPDATGHFHHLAPHMPGFEAAHLFGSVRFTLDVWERYLGQPLGWHFRSGFERLEISILRDWNNAQYGYGYLEVGSQHEADGRILPFSIDFDVIAHEIGHAIIYSVIGVPREGAELAEYVGVQESAADCVSLIAAMHFPSVLANVLEETRGNLYLFNRLARISAFSPQRQLRMASNSLTMADFADGWTDEHDLAQPLTGAVFDILVDIFHESLVARGLITPEVENLDDLAEQNPAAEAPVQAAFDRAYTRDTHGFHEALADARDLTGKLLAETFWSLSADYLDYGDVGRAMLAVDRQALGGRFARPIRRNFRRRHLGSVHAGPRLKTPDRDSHTHSPRTLLPEDLRFAPWMSYRERHAASRFTHSDQPTATGG